MALINIDKDPWLAEHASCERLHQAISEQLFSRCSEARESENYARLSASIRVRLKQYETEVEELKRRLEVTKKSAPITSEEFERRQRLVETLKSKHIQLLQRFNDRTKVMSNFAQDRSTLLTSKVVADGGTTGWGLDDDDDDDRPNQPLLAQSSDWSVQRLREKQKKIVQDQDEGLENLSRVISRQKEIAVSINCEVALQNEVIDDIAVKMDSTAAHSRRETDQINVILQKDSTWGYWLIILVLFLAIVVVAVV